MFHYTTCGLRNVWLCNGYDERETPYGRAVAIRDLDGLHRAIARWLIAYKPRLSGAEFRFLRKELGLSQAAAAGMFGNEAQSVALWERKGHVPAWADRFLRALYRERADGNAKIEAMIDRLKALKQSEYERLTLKRGRGGWKAKAA
ncbi:MAG TPA: hypothetical protein VJJ77_10460 [Dongiaceae bacterium]|nr:hypothetical protein [Dongiaceae bacterium]